MAITFAKPEVKKEEGVATITYEGNALLDNTEIDKDVIKDVFKAVKATDEAIVEEAINQATAVFKDDKKIDRVVVHTNNGVSTKDTTVLTIDRSKTYGIPGTDKSVTNSAMSIKRQTPSLEISKSQAKARVKAMYESIC